MLPKISGLYSSVHIARNYHRIPGSQEQKPSKGSGFSRRKLRADTPMHAWLERPHLIFFGFFYVISILFDPWMKALHISLTVFFLTQPKFAHWPINSVCATDLVLLCLFFLHFLHILKPQVYGPSIKSLPILPIIVLLHNRSLPIGLKILVALLGQIEHFKCTIS